MKIAISATGPSLDAEVEPRFGRCPCFVIVDPDTMQFETVDNASAMAAGGAGTSAAQMIASKGAQVIITGNCGPNAYQVLSAAGIQIITGVSGKVQDAIQSYKSGQFEPTSQPNVASHFGVGRSTGMGGGMGRGMGKGMGAGMMPGAAQAPQPISPEQELETLKAQLEELTQHMSDVQRRIEELQKGGG